MTNEKLVDRRWVISRGAIGAAIVAVPGIGGVLLIEDRARGLGGTALQPLSAEYAQDMGATDADGYVAELPLGRDGKARRMFVDSTNGSDANNGLSPYAGFRPNGSGPFGQYDATGKGKAAKGWGPKRTMLAAERTLPILNVDAGDAGVGHQVLLAEAGSYPDATAAIGGGLRASRHYGQSVTHPFVIQSYDPADPWNGHTMGRATGARRPEIRLSTDRQWNFTTNVNSVGGAIGNFAFRGLRFTAPNGSRRGAALIAFNWSNISGDNILVENCDLGPCSMAFNNTSDVVAGKTRWSHNLIIRRCLIDNYYAPGTPFPALHTSGWIGVVIEDCVWNHAAWADTAEGRYLPSVEGGASIFTHDIYNAGSSQSPNIVRRCVSLDAAATFLSNRNNAEAYNNVVIDAPISGGAGGGVTNINLEQPNGNYFDIHHNLSIGGGFIEAPRIIFMSQPVAGHSFIGVGGVEFEFVVPGGSPTTGRSPIVIGADFTATARNTVAVLNARTEPVIARVRYRLFAGAQGPEIRQTPKSNGAEMVQVGSQGPNIATPDAGFRSFAFGSTNGVAMSKVRDNLAINSGFTSTTSNQLTGITTGIGDGVAGRTSYANFLHNRYCAWGMSREALPPAPGTIATFTANRYDDSSPYTNDHVYQALGFVDKEALRTAIIARFEQPWAIRIQTKVGELFGFDFAGPRVAQPTVVTHPASTQAPRVGETITFADPSVTGGTIVSATTYVDNRPIPATGANVTTFTPMPEHKGRRISRMVVVAPQSGGPTVTVATEIAALVRD